MVVVRFISWIFILNICRLCLVVSMVIPHVSGLFAHNYQVRVKTSSICMSQKEAPLGGNVGSRSFFRLSEIFGAVFTQSRHDENKDIGPAKAYKPPTTDMSENTGYVTAAAAVSLQSIANTIRNEYESIFWVTGNMDLSLWREDCTFADPFSFFGGPGATQRFKANADNLGRFVLDPTMRITSFTIDEDDYTVAVGWIYSSKLKLPWKPVLAASGVTTHYIDRPSGLIYRYEERWKSNPWDVVKRLFVPT